MRWWTLSKVNVVLVDVARELGVDLWLLDSLWWVVVAEDLLEGDVDLEHSLASPDTGGEETQRFGLERHLPEFLRDNWEKTSLGREWDVHVEDGEVVGYEYPTPIGRIDLLAHHRTERAWLVVELKRNQSSDDTVGQVMRYMGFVSKKLASHGDRVEGLIISHAGDERLYYALAVNDRVKLMTHEVDFRLKEPPRE